MRGLKNLVVDGFLTAILFVLQVALGYLPNIELVSLLVIIYTLVLGKRIIPILLVFTVLEGAFYGFGVWWVSYLYLWPILALITWLLRGFRSHPWVYAVASCLFGLSFGLLASIPYLAGGFGAAFTWWVAGIPFDILHGISNFVLALILFRPIYRMLERLCHSAV